ncbi:MAG: hypothetical protein PHO42_02325 [Candidatus Omnitrophica bacterium]|nr:hypothetical protein [Candidatus Omnitrophota bacterium]
MSFLKKIFMVVIGVILLPLTVTVSKAFYYQLAGISIFDSKNQLYFLWGVTTYVIIYIFFFKLNYVYNFGHEFVHVISTWLSFGKAGDMKVSSKGGSVKTSKSNFFINISPYFIPIWTILLCLTFLISSKFTEIAVYAPYFIFFIGLTLAMHIILTVEALKIAQPDIIKTGYLFSLSLIYVINIVIVAFVMSLIFAGFSFIDFFTQFYIETRDLCTAIFVQLFRV